MLILRPQGLFCPAGDFYIDPSGAVDHALITHAHSDHARRGSQKYYCTSSGVSLLKSRLGNRIQVFSLPFGQKFQLGPVQISFHPAGHILGSSQVRLERDGEVWVASGDYEREADPTCEPFEVVPCDVFITEATFGTPSFQWNNTIAVGPQILDWWQSNAARGVNSVLFAYSLGKTQRILGLLHNAKRAPIYCHPAASTINACYRAEGVLLAETICLSTLAPDERPTGALFIVPQAFMKSPQASVLGDKYETSFASGWMARSGVSGDPSRETWEMRGYDRGFVMSDHADWEDLLHTIRETGAKTVFVQHRGRGALVSHLRKLGVKAFPDSALRPLHGSQMDLF